MKKLLLFFTCIIMLLCIPFSTCIAHDIDNNKNESNCDNKKIVYLTFDDGPGGKFKTQV